MSYIIVEPPDVQDLITKAVNKMNQKDEVLRYVKTLCEALEQDFKKDSIRRANFFNQTNPEFKAKRLAEIESGECLYKFDIESGRKYHKIIMETADGNRSVHAFVDKVTGDLYKSASFKSPAKGVRFNLLNVEQREFVLENCNWAGEYLYR